MPPDSELLDELATVRLRESSPGVLRLDHDSGNHDDQAVALGLAVLALVEHFEVGGGGFSVPAKVRAEMLAREVDARGPGIGGSLMNPAYSRRPVRGTRADGSANSPDRVTHER